MYNKTQSNFLMKSAIIDDIKKDEEDLKNNVEEKDKDQNKIRMFFKKYSCEESYNFLRDSYILLEKNALDVEELREFKDKYIEIEGPYAINIKPPARKDYIALCNDYFEGEAKEEAVREALESLITDITMMVCIDFAGRPGFDDYLKQYSLEKADTDTFAPAEDKSCCSPCRIF